MKITFEEGRDNGYLEYFAISQLEKYKGKVYDELMWAEITPGIRKHERSGRLAFEPNNTVSQLFRIIWEDDWQHPLFFDTFDQAKDHVLKNHFKHTPHINGSTFEE